MRQKETKAMQELLDVIGRIMEHAGIGEIKDASPSNRDHVGLHSIKGKKILLVEDNELNMDIAEYMLSDAGATVTKAVNGKDAWELFDANPPGTFDAILMDIQMPVMDGYEATRKIRNSEHRDAAKIPIIAMTAGAFPGDVQAAKEAGMSAYITKPLNGRELVYAIIKAYSQNS